MICASPVQRVENERLRDENKALKAENAHLRQQLADVTESMGRVEERCAKLRELLYGEEAQRRIAGIGEGVTPTYHSTGSVDEAHLVIENVKLQK